LVAEDPRALAGKTGISEKTLAVLVEKGSEILHDANRFSKNLARGFSKRLWATSVKNLG